MPQQVTTIKIDRSDRTQVEKHIRNVFKSLQKKKTEKLLAVFYQWYQMRPEFASKDLIEFDAIPRKNKADLEKLSSKKTVDAVYGDKYATVLTRFVRANNLHEKELIRLAEELKDLSKFEGKNKLGFSKTLSSSEINLLKDVFKLLRSESGVATVNVIPKRKSKSAEKALIDAALKAQSANSIKKDTYHDAASFKDSMKTNFNFAAAPTFEEFHNPEEVIEPKNMKMKSFEAHRSSTAVHIPKQLIVDLTANIESLSISAEIIRGYY